MNNHLSELKTKPTIKLMRPAKTDQPAHPRSLIRVFADRLCLLQPPGYQKRDEQEPLPYRVHLQADVFVLRFYGPVSPMGSCRARSVYLTTRLLGRLSPLSG